MDRSRAPLRLQVPERTIERVARRAWRNVPLWGGTVEPVANVDRHGGDGVAHAVDGLVIASIGHAFAASAGASVEQFSQYHDGFGLGTAADRKCARDRPML